MSLTITNDRSYERSRFSLRVKLPSSVPQLQCRLYLEPFAVILGRAADELNMAIPGDDGGAVHSRHTGAACLVSGGWQRPAVSAHTPSHEGDNKEM